jgi:hypothetical protein
VLCVPSIKKNLLLVAKFTSCLVVKFISRLEIVDSISKPLTIYNDNSAMVCFSKNDKRSTGSKHIHIKYLVVREKIQELQTSIVHIATEEMIADPLTKGLPPKFFLRSMLLICTHMGLVEIFLMFWLVGVMFLFRLNYSLLFWLSRFTFSRILIVHCLCVLCYLP